MLIDSHCHLDPHNMPVGADIVIERARDAGVGGFVCVGVGADPGPAQHAVALAERRPDVVAVIGLHPHDASQDSAALFEELSRLARSSRVIAVGEIGLDYHYDFSPRDKQRDVFRKMIALAREVGKPIVIHTREASDDTLTLLKEEDARSLGGVFHCFSEDVVFARKALDLGFDISLSGIVTFPKAATLHEVARFVPADRYYVETDSPYLAPVPFRGRKCEPAYVVHTARKIAELRGVSFEQVAEETTANVQRRFGIRQWGL
jgi:TatD DNase family protein